MTVLRQNILTIVPLFIVLGILYALVSYLLQMKEFNWAMNEEAAGVGHTVNEFVSHNFDEYFIADSGVTSITSDLDLVLKRISNQDLMRSVILIDTKNDTLFSAISNKFDPVIISDSLYQSTDFITPEDSEYRYALISTDESTILRIESIVHNPADSTQSYIFQFDRDGVRYTELKQHIHQWIMVEIAIFLIIGLLVSLALSLIIKNRIQKLYRESVEFISGNLNVNLDKGPITEFNDLGSTLDILVNVFNKNIDWYRKSIIEKEQLRTTAHLAENFKSRTKSPINKKIGSLSIIADYVGTETFNYILGSREHDTNFSVLTGNIVGDDPIEKALLTDSIALLFNRYKKSNQEFLTEIQTLFQDKSLHCKIIQVENSNSVTVYELKQNHVTSTQRSFSSESNTIWEHFMDDDAHEKIDFYSKHASAKNQKLLFLDIQKLLELVGSTTLISIQKSQDK